MKTKTRKELLAEIEELRTRLEVSEETLRTLQVGDKAMLKEIAQLASFPELNPNPVMEVDLAGNVHYLNPAMKQLFPELQTIGPHHPYLSDLSSLTEMFKHQGKSSIIRELKINNCWYEQAIYYVSENNRLRIYGLDITDHKKAEEEHQRLHIESENEKRRLEAIMEALPVGVAITDARGGNIRSNKTFDQLWGSPRPMADSVADYIAYKAWWSETGKPIAPEEWASAKAVKKGQAVVGQLLEIQRFDGTRASVINSGAPIFDAEGKIAGCAVAIQDITELRKAEKALHESEERLRRMIETSPVAIGFGDSTGKIFEANESFYRLTGYTREEIQARQLGWDKLTAPEYAELDRQIMATLATTGSAGPYEKEYIRKDGSRVPLLLSVSKFPGRDEHIAFIVDITEHMRMEEALRSSVARYRGLYEAISSGVVVQDRNGIIIEANAVACEILGLTLDQVRGRTSLDHQWHAIREDGSPFPGEDHPSMLTLRTGRAVRGTVMGVFNPSTKNYRWILINSEPILDPTTSQVQTVVTSFLDITEQKQIEENLKYSERKYRELYEGSQDGFVLVDMEGHIKDSNYAYMEMLGYSEEELKKLTYMDLTPQKWHVMEAKIVQEQVLSKGYSTVYEKEYIKKDGTIFPISLRTYLIKETNGNPKGMWAFVRDITKRKEMEEALRRSRDELEIRVQERTAELAEQSKILEGFFTSTITPLVFLDRDFNFIRVNEAYAKACQREISEFPGHNHFEFYPSDAKEIFEQVVETKTPYQAIARPFSFPDHPEWGTTYWDWTLTPLLDDKGEVEFLVFSLEDVTERKRAEKVLKAEQQRFNDLLELLPVYLVLLAPDYHVPFANRFFRERFGESQGRRCFEYLFDRSEPCEICETYTVMKTKAPHHWEWTGPDGRIYDVYDFPFIDRDGSTLIMEMGIDITERKRAEEALKESESRLRYLSSQLLTVQENERKRVARELHDGVGQILTAVKFKVESTIQEMGEGKGGPKKKPLEDIIPMIKESIDEVRRIQMDLRPSILDDLGILATLEWFFREYHKIYSYLRIEKEIGIQENEVSTPLKTVVYRVVQEAMNNIAKHSKADLVKLSLGKGEDKIQLVIQDNGQGFDLNEILSPERVERGLGLNSMRERTELSAGAFEIESAPGEGTTIKATWPL